MTAELDPTLSPEELYKITHYKRGAEQLRVLAQLGIPAVRRHDNTICVLRVHAYSPPSQPEPQRPRLKV